MDKIELNAQKREEVKTKGVTDLKKDGIIPGVVYGKGLENQNLKMSEKDFEKVYEAAGYCCVVDLKVKDGEEYNVLIKDVQFDTLTNKPIHVDFYKINMDEEATARIDLNFIGKSKAVVEKGGILIKKIDTLLIKCLPDKLVRSIDVDITPLDDVNTSVKIKDIILPEGIVAIQNENEVVTSVARSRKSSVIESVPDAGVPVEAKVEDVKSPKADKEDKKNKK